MLVGLVEPILAAIPAPLAVPARAALTGHGDVVDLARCVHGTVERSLSGLAGDALTAAMADSLHRVERIVSASGALDSLEDDATSAVSAAATDITSIAQNTVRELAHAATTCLMGGPATANPAALMVTLLPIAEAGYGQAHARLQQLEAELDGLAVQVDAVDIPDKAEVVAPAESPAEGPAEGFATSTEAPAPVMSNLSATAAEPTAVPSPNGQAQAAVAAARSALGTPYQWGGNTPGVGLDCSGLTQWAYAQAGVDIPRTADAQAVGPAVSRSELQPGDLAVWDGHVAMVVDQNNFIEAGDPVQISPIRETNMGMGFKGFYRPTAM